MKHLPTRLYKLVISLILFFSGTLSPFSFSPEENALTTIPTVHATAQTARSADKVGSFACILETAYFYAAPDERRGLFLLPKTYYVKVIDYQSDFCKIEYLTDSATTRKLVGYAKSDQLTFVDYVPQRPYLYYVFDLTYTAGDTIVNDSSFLTQITLSYAYYGDFSIGTKTYCYVFREDTFGYVPKPETLSYEDNTEYADSLTPTPDEPVINEPKEKQSSMQIATLIALCLLLPILASLIVKPPKRPPYESDE